MIEMQREEIKRLRKRLAELEATNNKIRPISRERLPLVSSLNNSNLDD
jgi:hypothetical protein